MNCVVGLFTKNIGGVIVSMLSTSEVERGLSHVQGQVKPKIIKLVLAPSPLSRQRYGVRGKTS